MERCLKCILPSTFPRANLNNDRICEYCLNGVGVVSSSARREPLVLATGTKVLVGLSGGRDSCFGVKYIHENFGVKVIAFTYDWPLVTDEARANASRVVSKLRVEHVIRAPDSFHQIRHIRRIVWAISRYPHPGLIPLLLSCDKFFFSEAKKVAKKYATNQIVFCAGNPLEYTGFKSGLLGAHSDDSTGMLHLGKFQIIRLVLGYANLYIKNPRLFLAGVSIPLKAFLVTYLYRPKITYLFQHIPWDEEAIEKENRKLGVRFDNRAGRIDNWRAGDGTAEFYNFLYRRMLGYDERTVQLANRVRSGLLTRELALRIEMENASPNLEALAWYASRIGFQLDEFLRDFEKHLIKRRLRKK